MFKVWLIPSTDSTKLYVVSKHLHCVADGLDLLQLFALAQDDEQARVTNGVKRPARVQPSIFSVLSNLAGSLYSLHRMWHFEFFKHLSLIKDHEKGHITNVRDFHISGDIAVNEVVTKAKSLGVTVNEYFLGAISVAINKITNGKEISRVNFVMPMSVTESPKNLKDF